MNRENSRRIFEEALTLIPGGVNSPARAFGGVGGTPVVVDRAEGAYLYDVDGNRYVDYVLSWGPMILGHGDARVKEALAKAIERGVSYGAPTEAENRLAALLAEMVPSIEKSRLVNSGTEATMSAIRLARGYTGRNKLVKFSGCYHGHADSLLVAAGSAAATLAVPDSLGVTPGAAADTIVMQYNDVEGIKALFAERGEEIACVIVEPIAGNMGCAPGTPEFLRTLREETEKSGAVLIFDEVMSGFRVARGGAQELYGITPDLTTLGKIVGGGLPVGAYGGRAEIMNEVAPLGKVYQAGTLSGNPLATAAGIATLEAIKADPDFYAKISRATERLANGLTDVANRAGVKVAVQWIGGMSTIFFLSETDEKVVDWPSASRCDKAKFAKFFHMLLDGGVYFPCSQFETMFTSAVHTDEIIDETIAVAASAFKMLQ